MMRAEDVVWAYGPRSDEPVSGDFDDERPAHTDPKRQPAADEAKLPADAEPVHQRSTSVEAPALASRAADIEHESTPGEGLPYASEMALAEVFARRSRDKFRWSPGLDWMRNLGTHWERDDVLARYSLAKMVCRDAAKPLGEDRMRYRLTAAATVNSLVSLARSEPGIATQVDQWDRDPMLLNTRGGVFDLRTGKRVDGSSGLLFTQVTAVAPDFTMKTPVWQKFLSDVFAEDVEVVEFIQRMSGYCLTGDTSEQKLFFLHGQGSNGKSVFIEALRAILGSYSHNLPSEALMRQRGEAHPTVFASLFGKRLAVSSELEENAFWAESKVKQLTGDETLTARYMRQDFFTFRLTHKHVIAGNFRPRLKGDDFAMARRMVLVPFDQTFSGSRKDPALPQKLRAEYPGILAWFIAGARKWVADGLRIPAKIQAASQAYMADNDDLAMWIEECCRVGDSFRGRSSELYASFRVWKEAAGEHAASERSFSQRLETRFRKYKDRSGRYFAGIEPKETSRPAETYGNRRW